MEPVIGIDLGTTNSEVSFVFEGTPRVIAKNSHAIMPSCVGLDEDGTIIVGEKARNRAVLAPENTVLSVKRLMGSDAKISLGAKIFTPQEISAFILRELKKWAELEIGRDIGRAVITVPAYFTDAQRQATREAGQIAGLEVERIINEPTAASLAYEKTDPQTRTILVYDLGGGTFDVSIVRIESGVVEVLASTGDNHLGGDDFDDKIVAHLMDHMETELKLKKAAANPLILARLKNAAETAKKTLSQAPYATIEEDHIGKNSSGDQVHLDLEISRMDFEAMIANDLERTMDSVKKALDDAKLTPASIDKVILVGGSTRIPMVSRMLEEKIGRLPHSEIDPDLCVAIGAGMQASRQMGIESSGVLVDITPYTFGTVAFGEVDGMPSYDMFVPLIRRNTKLPARKSDLFSTLVNNQEAVDIKIFQGENPNALDNVLLGNYYFKLTKAPAGSEIILDFDLDLNGILRVKAIEKKTGKNIEGMIENAISRFSEDQLQEAKNRVDKLFATGENPAGSSGSLETAANDPDTKDTGPDLSPRLADIVHRAQAKMGDASDDDSEEMVNLIEDIHDAVANGQLERAEELGQELEDILFYLD
jgi:molecular chaperone DnaK (HSP70)